MLGVCYSRSQYDPLLEAQLKDKEKTGQKGKEGKERDGKGGERNDPEKETKKEMERGTPSPSFPLKPPTRNHLPNSTTHPPPRPSLLSFFLFPFQEGDPTYPFFNEITPTPTTPPTTHQQKKERVEKEEIEEDKKEGEVIWFQKKSLLSENSCSWDEFRGEKGEQARGSEEGEEKERKEGDKLSPSLSHSSCPSLPLSSSSNLDLTASPLSPSISPHHNKLSSPSPSPSSPSSPSPPPFLINKKCPPPSLLSSSPSFSPSLSHHGRSSSSHCNRPPREESSFRFLSPSCSRPRSRSRSRSPPRSRTPSNFGVPTPSSSSSSSSYLSEEALPLEQLLVTNERFVW